MSLTLGTMRRVMLIGSGGAGKSTLAVRLGERLGLPVVHLDARHWHPGWVATPDPEWRREVAALAAAPAWIIDGNYGGTLDLRLAAADTVVFLDLPRRVCLWRVMTRTVRTAGRSRPDMAAGCPERVDREYLGFLRWVWTYPATRRPGVLRRLAALPPTTRVVRLRSQREVDAWLDALGPRAGG
jgi:adenylate kinase family enzyme